MRSSGVNTKTVFFLSLFVVAAQSCSSDLFAANAGGDRPSPWAPVLDVRSLGPDLKL